MSPKPKPGAKLCPSCKRPLTTKHTLLMNEARLVKLMKAGKTLADVARVTKQHYQSVYKWWWNGGYKAAGMDRYLYRPYNYGDAKAPVAKRQRSPRS